MRGKPTISNVILAMSSALNNASLLQQSLIVVVIDIIL